MPANDDSFDDADDGSLEDDSLDDDSFEDDFFEDDAIDENLPEDDADDGGFSLSLPPFRLPPLFPEDFRVVWPVAGDRPRGRVSTRVVAAALVCFDVVDAVLAVAADSTVVAAVRVVGGALVAATTFGTLGVAYVWEAAAALAGYGEVTAVPTLTLLLVAGLLRDVL